MNLLQSKILIFQYWSFVFIAAFTIFPSLLLNVVSFVWWLDDRYSRKINDEHDTRRPFWTENIFVRILASIFQVSESSI